jgi:predicted dehydrogenase
MLKVAIIGLRHPHIFSIKGDVEATPGAKLVAVAEDEPSLQAKAESLGVPVYQDWRRMLERERPDVVAACPVNAEKGAVISECLERDLHVIADKPLVTTLEDLEAVSAAWAGSGKRLLLMLTLRYDAPFVALRRFVNEGGLGAPAAMYCTGPHRLNLPSRYPWMLRDDLCGGVLVDLGCHFVDAVRWIARSAPGCAEDEVLAVSATQGCKRFTDLPNFTDYGQVLLRLSSGASGLVQADWLSPDAAPYHGDMRFSITGTQGTAEVRYWPWPQVLVATNDRPPYALDLGPTPPSVGEDFLRAILEERETQLSTEDCLAATRLTLLARKAAETGTTVTVS